MDLFFALISNVVIVSILAGLAIFLIKYNFDWWLRCQRADNIFDNFYSKWVFMEIKIPREIYKSPQAMELILNSLDQGSGHFPDMPTKKYKKGEKWYKNRTSVRKEFYDRYIKGKVRLWSSLEIVSEEGNIRFFIVCPKNWSDSVRQQIYSHYPGIEVTETEDYMLKYKFVEGGEYGLWTARMKLSESDYLPIKTYIDYGLDRDPKEEHKIDPLTSLLEQMSNLGPGETFFYQIVIRSTIKKDWKDDTKKKIDEILGITRAKEDDKEKKIKKDQIIKQDRQAASLTPHEKGLLEALQRNIEKPGFDCMFRLYYLTKQGTFAVNRGVFTALTGLKGFNKPGYNTFGISTTNSDAADYPFTDPLGVRAKANREKFWYQLKMRAGFYFEDEGGYFRPFDFFKKWFVYKNFDWAMSHGEILMEYLKADHMLESDVADYYVLNSEELATIYHFPGKTFGNVGNKVESVKSEAPRNLPL